MKLNFWQWIGLGLLIVAVILIARKRIAPTDVVPQTTTTQPSSPATAPTTTP
jgi:hypothetical protein